MPEAAGICKFGRALIFRASMPDASIARLLSRATEGRGLAFGLHSQDMAGCPVTADPNREQVVRGNNLCLGSRNESSGRWILELRQSTVHSSLLRRLKACRSEGCRTLFIAPCGSAPMQQARLVKPGISCYNLHKGPDTSLCFHCQTQQKFRIRQGIFDRPMFDTSHLDHAACRSLKPQHAACQNTAVPSFRLTQCLAELRSGGLVPANLDCLLWKTEQCCAWWQRQSIPLSCGLGLHAPQAYSSGLQYTS